MGLFSKKDAGKGNTPAADTAPVSAKKAKKSELAKVLNESVWESVHEDFKANKQFILNDNGTTKYVALLFDTNDVGGLVGKEAKRDESKGSVIEAIKSGRIKTYIRPEMLDDEVFIIIPDVDTIDNMDEFSMFTNIKYTICTVTPDSIVETCTVNNTLTDDDPDLMVTLDDIEKFIKNGDDVKSLFPYMNKNGMPAEFGVPAPAPAADPVVAEEEEVEELEEDPEEVEELDEEESEFVNPVSSFASGAASTSFDGEPVEDEEAEEEEEVEEEEEETTEDDYSDVDSGATDDEGNYNAEDDYDEYEDITEEVLNDFVIRSFYSDDLGLEVSTEPFDIQFLHGNTYVPFNEDRGPGKLNEYLSNFAKDANTRMERLHNENLFRMRERYMRIIQGHCENITKTLDVSDDSTQYGKIRYAIEQNKAENYESIESAIAGKRAQLIDSWERKLEQVGASAAEEAKQAYIDRHSLAHENDLLNLETREKDEIERDYQNSMKRMNDDRRIEASKLLDLAINETLSDMSQLYLKVLRDEKREYIRLQNEMTRYIDDNRKDEKARIDALAEENRQVKKADEVRKEYTAKIRSMAAEFDVKKSALQADIDRIRKEHDIELENYESEWTDKLNAEKEKNAELQGQLDDLMKQYASLDEAKKAEYEARINTIKQERESLYDEMDHVIAVHNRSNKIMVFLIIAILLASMGIGFMFGTILNVRKTSNIEQQSLYEQSVQQTVEYGGEVDGSENK